MSDKLISQAIKKADNELRSQYPFLNYQDLIGGLIFLTSLAVIVAMWIFYFHHSASNLSCGFVMIIIALATSMLHELEHDLIHNLYFRKTTIVQDVMFFCIWVSKLHGNPWFRRELHLKHHIVSGQKDDAEERLIGLGLPFGFRRLAVTMHPFGSLIVTPAIAKDAKWLNVQRLNLTSMPVAFLFFGLNKLYILYIVTMLVVGYDHYHLYLPARHWWWIRAANVCICLPNILRQACLVAMSNCSHYYGDIPEKSCFYQNQILDHWIFFPFQLFCCNFGATHVVHHYVPGQPFYIREMVYRKVKPFMIEQGVRLNDFGIVSRGNRYFDHHDTVVSSGTGTTHCVVPTGEVSDETSKATAIKDKTISPNGSHFSAMVLWLTICSTIGVLSYVVFDQWTTVCLGRRIVSKYITKKKGE